MTWYTFTRPYTPVHGFTRLYTPFTRLYAPSHTFTRLYTTLHDFTRLCTRLHAFTHLYTPFTRLCTRLHAFTHLHTTLAFQLESHLVLSAPVITGGRVLGTSVFPPPSVVEPTQKPHRPTVAFASPVQSTLASCFKIGTPLEDTS